MITNLFVIVRSAAAANHGLLIFQNTKQDKDRGPAESRNGVEIIYSIMVWARVRISYTNQV